MKIGLYFSWETSAKLDLNDVTQQTLNHIKLAERLGYDSILIAEPPYDIKRAGFKVQDIVARAFEETESIHIGVPDRVIALEQPLELARELQLAADQGDSRFISGVAVGEDEEPYSENNIPFEQCRERFEEALDLLELAWKDDPFTYEGRHNQISRPLEIQPTDKINPPIWVTARDFPTLSSAAKRGYSILPHILSEHRVVVDQYQVYADMLKNNNRELLSVERPLVRDVFIGKSNEQAKDDALTAYTNRYRHHADFCEILDERNQPKLRAQCTVGNLLEHHLVIGNSSSVAEQLSALVDGTEIDQMIGRMQIEGINPEAVAESITLFANEVGPQLQ